MWNSSLVYNSFLTIRVSEGGHNIEENVIERRYINGINNLFDIYISIVDEVMIFDNSNDKAELIAEKLFDTELKVVNETKFNAFRKYHERV